MASFASSPELMEAIGRNYASGAFEGAEQAPQAEDFAFIRRAHEASASSRG